ncbi:MAG: hypothetical protein AAF393_18015 [Pseudomonadota bacterium]
MSAPLASLINAIVLIVMSAWAYVSVGGASLTALIPAGFGVALLICLPGVRSENKVIAHIAVLLTLVVLLALFMPLSSALSGGNAAAIFRAVVMMASCVLAMIYFIKSFRDARKAREAAGQ